MSSLNREAVFLILQFLDEEKFKDTVHKYGFFFLSTLCCFLFYASLCFLGFQFSLVLNDEYSEIFRNSVFFFFLYIVGFALLWCWLCIWVCVCEWRLEKESGFYFNMRYFEECVTNGEWDEVEQYISGFTKVDDNKFSMKIFFEIRKQKYLEALDR